MLPLKPLRHAARKLSECTDGIGRLRNFIWPRLCGARGARGERAERGRGARAHGRRRVREALGESWQGRRSVVAAAWDSNECLAKARGSCSISTKLDDVQKFKEHDASTRTYPPSLRLSHYTVKIFRHFFESCQDVLPMAA